jgi:hypothetical protein
MKGNLLSSPVSWANTYVTKVLVEAGASLSAVDKQVIKPSVNKGNNKITELRTILPRESPNS